MMTRALCATLLIGLAALPASGRQSMSELRGRVLDAQLAAVPGVAITVTNQATGTYREAVSNDDGTYFISGLAPGLYSIVAEMAGFKKYSRRDVRLDLGHTATLDLQLEIGSVVEEFTVTATTPLVDVTSKQVGGNITSREMVSLPSVNGNFVGAIALLPGIIASISVESSGADAVSANGMDTRNNNYMLDGANNNDDFIGQRAGPQARVPIEAIQELQVVTNQYDAQFGRTTGAVINAISKQGSNRFFGSGSAYVQRASLTRKNFFVDQNQLPRPDTKNLRADLNAGGPVVKDRAHFFFNVERVQVDRANTINILSHPELSASPLTEARVWNTLVRFDHQLSTNHSWAIRWLRESSPQLNQIVGSVTPAAAREEHYTDQTIVGTLSSTFHGSRSNVLRLNFTREDVLSANPGFDANGQRQDLLKPTLQYLTFVDQQSPVAQARVDNAYEIDNTLTWFLPGHHGEHDVKVGALYEFAGVRSTTQDEANGVFTFRTDVFFNPVDPRTYPERFTIRVPGPQNRYQKAHYVTAFAQDKWKASARTSVTIGLRYEVEIQPIVGSAVALPSGYPVDKNNVGPRIGFTHDLGADGLSIVRGGYGRFFDKTHFELMSSILTNGVYSDSVTVSFPTSAADPGPSAGRFPTDPFLVNGPVVNRALLNQLFPPGSVLQNTGTVTVDNPGRRIPYADQLTAGYERQLNPNLSVSLDYVHAFARDQLMIQDLNPGLRTSTARTATLVRVNPAFAGALYTPVNLGKIDYDALEVQLHKRFSANYSFRVAYTLSDSRGTTSGAGAPASGFQLLDDMRLNLNEGPTNVDRRHNLVVSGQTILPRFGGLNLSWTARALSGSHLTLIDSTTDPDRNGSFQEPLAADTYTGIGRNPLATAFDGTRNGATGPAFFQLDVRAGYLFHLPAQRTLNAFVDIFNLTNRANFDNPTGDRRSTDFLNLTTLRSGAVPTTFEIGARVAF